jgi:hypothetical protein
MQRGNDLALHGVDGGKFTSIHETTFLHSFIGAD